MRAATTSRSRRSRWWAIALVSALATTASVGAVFAPAAGAKTKAKTWDPRILEFVKYVEDERGLTFKHPIPVEFLGDKAFNKEVTLSDEDVTKADRKASKESAGDLFALGLVGPNVDLIGASNEVSSETVVGFYDDKTKHMVIRGKKIEKTDVKVTVVHELTHALQDQYFDLGKLDKGDKSSQEELALTALIEGDATWVEESYVATLPQDEQDKYYSGVDTSVEQSQNTGDAPAILDLFSGAPYDLGYYFVDYLRTKGDTAEVDRAFRRPPPSDEQVFDPISYINHERPKTPKAPALKKGEAKRGVTDELGSYGLYIVLASRIDPRTALTAAAGWNGDQYRPYAKGKQECIREAIASDTPADADELVAAFGQWAAKGPAGAATVEKQGENVVLDACGDKTATVPTQEVLGAAEDAATSRYPAFEEVVSEGVGEKDARCISDLLATDAELTALLVSIDPNGEPTADQQNVINDKFEQYFGVCGVPIPTG